MDKKILIITNSSDLHADIMISLLIDKGVLPFRLNLNEFPRNFEISLNITQNQWSATLTHIPSNDTLNVSDIGAVWTRKIADFSFISEDLSPQEKAHAKQETEHVLNSLLYSLDCYWINHPLASRSALWKGEQSIRAAKMGFKVPASLMTNQPDPVLRFKAIIHGEMITKSMSSPFLAADEVVGKDRVVRGFCTTLITDEDMQSIDSVREIPCYFQEYIAKQFELRVTVIGNQVFTAKIHSQENERTKIDFRDFGANIRYEAFQLPADIEQKCLDFVHSYQLQYGALDIIVTPDNEYVFLENNPAGQFLFVQQLVPELTIMEALADCLIEGAKCQS